MLKALKTQVASLMVLGCLSAFHGAQAADLGDYRSSPSYTPILASSPAGGWSGMYMGAHVGYGLGHARRANTDGFIGGAQLGFNLQFDRVVVGLEGDAHYSGVDYRGFSDAFSQKWAGSLRGRIGYTYDRFLPFFTAGFGLTSAQMKSGGAKDSHVHGGYILGAGAEYLLTERVSGVVQYLYRRDSSKTYAVIPVRNTDMVTNEFRLGINYHF